MPSFVASDCAEFPNDNPALHRGAIWCCEELVGAATPEQPPEAVVLAVVEAPCEVEPGLEPEPEQEASDLDDRGIEVVDEMTFDEIVDETPSDPPGPAIEADGFSTLVAVLESVTGATGGSAESITALRALLGVERLGGGALEGETVDALVAAGLGERTDHGPARSPALTREVLGWQALLRGETDDMSSCGAAPLDEWCARLVACALGQSARIDGLRRDLRRRGVAAFGLVEVAA